MTRSPEALARGVLAGHGRTYSDEAGIRLADQPATLFQLLVLTLLLSARIGAGVAVAAAAALRAAGWTTPQCMRDAPRSRAEKLLQEFTGIGPIGASVFLREVQAVSSREPSG